MKLLHQKMLALMRQQLQSSVDKNTIIIINLEEQIHDTQ